MKTCAFLPCSLCSRNLVHFSRVATFSISSSFFSPILSLSRAASIPTTSRSLLHRPCRRQIARIEPPYQELSISRHSIIVCVCLRGKSPISPVVRIPKLLKELLRRPTNTSGKHSNKSAPNPSSLPLFQSAKAAADNFFSLPSSISTLVFPCYCMYPVHWSHLTLRPLPMS